MQLSASDFRHLRQPDRTHRCGDRFLPVVDHARAQHPERIPAPAPDLAARGHSEIALPAGAEIAHFAERYTHRGGTRALWIGLRDLAVRVRAPRPERSI